MVDTTKAVIQFTYKVDLGYGSLTHHPNKSIISFLRLSQFLEGDDGEFKLKMTFFKDSTWAAFEFGGDYHYSRESQFLSRIGCSLYGSLDDCMKAAFAEVKSLYNEIKVWDGIPIVILDIIKFVSKSSMQEDLKLRSVTEKYMPAIRKIKLSDEVCAICMEKLINFNESKDTCAQKDDDDDLIEICCLNCLHLFHQGCIQKWQKSTCPLCRHIY